MKKIVVCDKRRNTEICVIPGIANHQKNINGFFLIVMGCIVFLMQCGFAFLEAGSVR